MKKKISLLALVAVAFSFSLLFAEKVDMTPASLRATSTHVIVGKVKTIYQKRVVTKKWIVTNYVAEVEVVALEKGKGPAKGELVYVRYWRQAYCGGKEMPPGTNGHRGLPSEGETLRIYLAKNAYDGFRKDNNDGGFNVIGANGFEKFPAKKKE